MPTHLPVPPLPPPKHKHPHEPHADTVLPDEVALSSGLLNLRRLFVHPSRARRGTLRSRLSSIGSRHRIGSASSAGLSRASSVASALRLTGSRLFGTREGEGEEEEEGEEAEDGEEEEGDEEDDDDEEEEEEEVRTLPCLPYVHLVMSPEASVVLC